MNKLLIATSLAVGLMLGNAAYAQGAAKLADTAGCMKCHDVEKKKMGAAFKAVAAKYKGNKDAEKTIVAKLKSGEGHPKGTASDADLDAIVKWVLAM
jgi:cytochrome c